MKHPTQMSEAFSTAIFLTLSGGFQDAYTYLTRNKVFANAQTGNIVLFSQNLAEGHWSSAVRYVVPLLSFILGVYGAEALRHHFQHVKRLHWRQLVLLIEIAILFPSDLSPKTQSLGKRVGIVRLRTPSADVSKSQRQRLRDDDVHREFEKWNGTPVHLP